MGVIRKQTYISPEQNQAVKRLAAREGTTEAEILRRALDAWLTIEAAEDRGDPFAALIGFVDGPEESDHDDIYR
jgi:hypothetical protein